MTTPPTVLVVVPTYNERDNLPVLARGVLAHQGFRMLVVDDGSPDGTGAVADALAVEFPGRIAPGRVDSGGRTSMDCRRPSRSMTSI